MDPKGPMLKSVFHFFAKSVTMPYEVQQLNYLLYIHETINYKMYNVYEALNINKRYK